MSTTKKITSQGAASTLPGGNAFLTVNSAGAVTPVSAAGLPQTSSIQSQVTPQANTEWLRVAECGRNPYYGVLSIIGTYAPGHGDGSPELINIGGGSTANTNYIKNRISSVVSHGCVSKVRAVSDNGKIYIDLMFASGGGRPVISLVGSYGVTLLTPYIAPAETDSSKIYICELS